MSGGGSAVLSRIKTEFQSCRSNNTIFIDQILEYKLHSHKCGLLAKYVSQFLWTEGGSFVQCKLLTAK